MGGSEQQLQTLLRDDITGFVLSLLVLFIGLAALGVHLLRLQSKDKTLLWFGLFTGLYGIRSLVRHSITQVLFDVPPVFWRYLDAVFSNIIITPALLFFEGVYGKGWKSGWRWLLWAQAVWGAIAIVADLWQHDPGYAPDPANLLIFTGPVLMLIGHLRGYRPPQSSWTAIIFAGGAMFLVSVMIDHLRNAGFTPWQVAIEPVGFLANLACLSYVAVQRFVTNEQQLVAIEQEMKSAARIQASILPGGAPRVPGLRIAVRYLPMTAVAGDFYDFLAAGGGEVGILVADVTGHGVPAALVASMVKVAAASQVEHAADPARVISALNQVMCRQAQGQLTTAGYLFLDVKQGEASYAAAGHPPLLLWRKAEERLYEFRENGLLMGIRPAEKYATTTIELKPGDRLLLYTDGIPEAANRAEELFGEERLAEFISGHQEMTAERFADALLERLAEWSGGSGNTRTDDITLVVVDVVSEM